MLLLSAIVLAASIPGSGCKLPSSGHGVLTVEFPDKPDAKGVEVGWSGTPVPLKGFPARLEVPLGQYVELIVHTRGYQRRGQVEISRWWPWKTVTIAASTTPNPWGIPENELPRESSF